MRNKLFNFATGFYNWSRCPDNPSPPACDTGDAGWTEPSSSDVFQPVGDAEGDAARRRSMTSSPLHKRELLGGVCRAASCFSPPSSFFPPPLLPLLHVRSLANPRARWGQGAADPPFQRGAAASPEICEGADCRGRRQSGAQPPTLSACARARACVAQPQTRPPPPLQTFPFRVAVAAF